MEQIFNKTNMALELIKDDSKDPPRMGPPIIGILMGVVWVPLTIFGGPMSLGVPKKNPIELR